MSDAVVRMALVASAVAAFGAGPRVTQDRQQPVFKGSTVVVAVDAVVRDSGGNPIRDLTRGDFQILEDGESRDLQTCTLIGLPVTRGAPGARVIVRPVATNAGDGRVYVIAIDAFHMTPAGAHRITPILEQFITDYVEPTDLVSVVRLDYAARGSEFTSDKARLLSLVGAAHVPGGSNAPPQMAAPLGNGPLGPTAQITERMLGTLASAMRYAARPQGRRTTVLLVSEGIETDIFSAGAGNDEALRTLDAQRDAIEAAARANVNIYAIDPRGMSAIDAGVATASADGASAGDGGRPRGLRQWDSLRTLAGETGGRAIVGALDLRQSFAQLVQEDSTYYSSAMAPPTPMITMASSTR